ncbi:MAG: aminotransferase class I/II-fold pyridoxal phosphate-dependent enzyme [archaeon]
MKHVVSVSMDEETIIKIREILRNTSHRNKSHVVEEAAAHVNAKIISSDLSEKNGFKWNKQNLKDYLGSIKKEPKVDLYWLCTPNNPTGTTIPMDNIEQIVAKASEKNKLVVVDEAYGEYIDDTNDKRKNSAVQLLDKYSNLIVTRTVSKGLGLAGIRVGYAIGSPEVIEIMEKMRLQFPTGILNQKIAKVALEDTAYMNKVREQTVKAREQLIEGLGDSYIIHPSETSVLTIKGTSGNNLVDKFAKEGIIVQGLGYLPNMDGYVRLTVRSPEENAYVIKKMNGGG